MNDGLQIVASGESAVEIRHGGGPLLRYVFLPATPANESPRPYAHPVRTLAGTELTDFRPEDHPWHHGLSFTLNRVGAANFWGGPTYHQEDGYQWRADHGCQRHLGWIECGPKRLVESLEWRDASGAVLLSERRTLTPMIVSASDWSLHWQARLENVSGRGLALGNCHSRQRLAGSHYTGLQFRGAPRLLDGDDAAVSAEGGLEGEAAVHAASARWMAWRGRREGAARPIAILFANHGNPLRWFVRRREALAAFPLQFDQDIVLAAGEALQVDHSLTFSDA